MLNSAYLNEIFDSLHRNGMRTFHVLLDADDEILHERIGARDVARAWRLRQLTTYTQVRPSLRKSADLVVDTTQTPTPEVAQHIADAFDARQREFDNGFA